MRPGEYPADIARLRAEAARGKQYGRASYPGPEMRERQLQMRSMIWTVPHHDLQSLGHLARMAPGLLLVSGDTYGPHGGHRYPRS